MKSLLASDMDGTVIPLDQEGERHKEIAQFRILIENNPDLMLAYVTGRHLELGLAGVQEFCLPKPAVFVCDVGTAIFWRKLDAWIPDSRYRNLLLDSWAGFTGKMIADLLAPLDILILQEPEKQGEFKLSYYVSLSLSEKMIVSQIMNNLQRASVKANIIYSVDAGKKVGLVDILPPMAAKDFALGYLAEKTGLASKMVVYAGDSGNDLLAFLSGFPAIVVANTPREVKEKVKKLSIEKGIQKKIYFAKQKYIQGVVEGCYHFGLFKK